MSLLFGIVRSWCDPPGSVLGQWGVLAALVLAGTALVPVVVMPQIILAGVIAPLSGLSDWLAKGLVSTYWGTRGLQSLLPADDLALLATTRPGNGSSVTVIGVHVVVFVVLTWFTLWWQGRVARRG